jgi:hypothetical protein
MATEIEIGSQYYKWTILKKSSRKDTYMSNPYLCKCSCGEMRLIDASRLVKGHSKSCRQCSNKSIANSVRGISKPSGKKGSQEEAYSDYNIEGEYRMNALLTSWRNREYIEDKNINRR